MRPEAKPKRGAKSDAQADDGKAKQDKSSFRMIHVRSQLSSKDSNEKFIVCVEMAPGLNNVSIALTDQMLESTQPAKLVVGFRHIRRTPYSYPGGTF